MMPRFTGLAHAALISIAVAPSLGQAAPVDDALRELQAFYASQPTCERIRVEYRTPAAAIGAPPRVSRSSIIVRVQPETPPAPQPDAASPAPEAQSGARSRGLRSLALDLPPLRLHAEGDQLIVVHERNPATFFESTLQRPLAPRTLNEALPPVPMPQADLASVAHDASIAAFWPYARTIRWTELQIDPRQPKRRTLRGVGEAPPTRGLSTDTISASAVNITLVMQGPRLHTLTFDNPTLGTQLALSFTPIQPCDPARFGIDLARRTRIQHIDELQPKGGTLRVGVRVPALPLTEAAGKGWSIDTLLDPPPAAALAGAGPAEHVALVLMRVLPEGAESDLVRFNPETLSRLLAQLRTESFRPPREPGQTAPDLDPAPRISRFAYAPVLIMTNPTPDEVLRRLRSADDSWVGKPSDSRASTVLWSTEPRSTIDLFAPGAEVVVIILDPELVLRAVIAPAKGDSAEMVADRIAATLFELVP